MRTGGSKIKFAERQSDGGETDADETDA